MALDGLFLHCIRQELEAAIVGAKVDKIYQPSSEELVLTLRSRDLGTRKLLLCARANSPRVQLTNATYENPATPPMLCMLLRKRLGGATVLGLRQAGFDRVLFLDFSATNEMGDKEELSLAVEIMAQYSNVVLLGPDGKIIDALKRVDLTRSSKRLILPGLVYELPPRQDKLELPDHSVEELVERIRSFRNKTLSSAVLSSVEGVSPVLAREVAFRAVGDDKHITEMTEDDFVDLEYPLLELKKETDAKAHHFCVVRDETGRPFEFSFLSLRQYGPSMAVDTYETASELLDEYYAKRDSMERIAHKSSDLKRFLNTATERIARKVEVQRGELAQSVDREKLRVYAELINANLYQLEKGVLYYDLENYYDENRILRVPADPALSPAQNSQKYYKAYRKTYTAEKKLAEQIEQGTEELAYLETVKDALSRAETERDIGEIRRELVAGGYLKDRAPVKKGGKGRRDGKAARSAKQPPSLPPIEYETTDGFRVRVGRNNLQNDKLSLKSSNKLDMWLHTKDYPGSHVVIEAKDGEISDRAIEEAAIIAAVNSTASSVDKVPVDYTLVKNLKKPAGARPGKVIFHQNWTIYVTPDEDFAERLRKK
ncbi:MAG: NFACT family protein [Clostridia bacterium]|nr:NFACT family protein [Clostridia bacterium]